MLEEQRLYQYYKDEKEGKISQRVLIWCLVILVVFYVLLFITNSWFQNNYRYVTINGTSMQPTLNPNPVNINGNDVQDAVYIKLTSEDITYGDIIIIDKSTYNYNTSVIKRLLALDGDQISIAKVHVVQGNENYTEYRFMRIKEGSSEIEIVYEDYIAGYGIWNSYVPILDNEVYYEPYFYRMFLEDSQTTTHYVEGVGNVKFYTVMPGQIFYMGDNRTGSTDARWTGTDSQENVIGRVVSIVHNSTSIKNSLFWWTGRIKEYFAIVFDEIIKYFAWTY